MADDDTLRVLLLTGEFAVRGTCAYTLRLLEHLGKCGVEAEMVCSNASRVPPAKRRSLPIRERPRLGARMWWRRAAEELAETLAERPPELIHVQARNVARAGLHLAELAEVPYVLTVHDFLSPGERLPISQTWCLKLIAVSQAVGSDLIGRSGVPEELVEVIPGGVDVEPYFTPPDATEWEDRTFVVGTAGPLEKVKGQSYFLEAARLIREAGFDCEFLIAGAGPDENRLRALARELAIADHVTFAPQVHEYSEVLEAVDIFCLPSLQQGLGTVMLEAMALGKPVVASDVGGVRTVVRDNETGVLIPKQDSRALAGKVIQMLRNPQWARTLARNGQRLVAREFNAEHMVEHTATLYRRVLKRTLEVAG